MAQCDNCAYYAYDEEYEEYYCTADMDEDDVYEMELRGSLSPGGGSCRFYRDGDEYAVVRKQN